MGTGSFPGVKCGRGVLLTTHPLLAPKSWKSRDIPLPPPSGPQTGLWRGYFTFIISLRSGRKDSVLPVSIATRTCRRTYRLPKTSPQTSGSDYPLMQRHIRGQNLQVHHRGNLERQSHCNACINKSLWSGVIVVSLSFSDFWIGFSLLAWSEIMFSL